MFVTGNTESKYYGQKKSDFSIESELMQRWGEAELQEASEITGLQLRFARIREMYLVRLRNDRAVMQAGSLHHN